MRLEVVLFALLSSCATAPPSEIDRVSGPDYTGVILSAAYARRTYYSDGAVWTPTRRMVTDFERRLARRLRDQHATLESKWPLRRQYLGLFEYGTGRRLMRARLFGHTYSDETQLALPAFLYYDSDTCLCDGWYDPRHKQIVDFGCVNMRTTAGRYPHDRDKPPEPPARSHSTEMEPPPVDERIFQH